LELFLVIYSSASACTYMQRCSAESIALILRYLASFRRFIEFSSEVHVYFALSETLQSSNK
jgi:hypothetical protein